MLATDYIALFVSFVAAATDLIWGKVYNQLTYTAAGPALLLSLLSTSPAFVESLIGLLGALVLFYFLHRFIGMGAGDVKLMAVIGALKGFPFVLGSSFYILCSGVALGLFILVWRGRLLTSLQWVFSVLTAVVMPGRNQKDLPGGLTTMPFAPSIFLGVAYAIYLESSRGRFTFDWWV